MNTVKLILISSFAFAGLVHAQSSDPTGASKPSVNIGTGTRVPPKNTVFRTIQGVVKDQADNPVSGALVQLKNLRTSKVIEFPTKDDGKFIFRELSMDVDYELITSHAGVKSPVRKVSPYDSRKEITVNFKLEAAAAASPSQPPKK